LHESLSNTYIPLESLVHGSAQTEEPERKKLYVETYGCQMNFADTEIVNGIMGKHGYDSTENINDSAIILINTCSIRENAEVRVYQRLTEIKKLKRENPKLVVGIIGCMAERLKRDIFKNSKVVDLILGPDEYKKLPLLIDNLVDNGEKGIAVKLSRVETYDDILPIRKEGIAAYISIMRGCDNFCSFCVVPYTRGRERSRPLKGVVSEIRQLWNEGFKDVTLLGQNVNSYRSEGYDFADLLKHCAEAAPELRIKFSTSHPQDLSMKLIETIAEHDNLCKYIHLPVQSGSNRVLELMKRNYTIEHYMGIMENIKKLLPEATLSTDIITGFCSETEEDHRMTMDIMKEVKYDGAFMFKYSPREKTKAWDMDDNVDEETKTRRLIEIVEMQRKISEEINSNLVGKEYEIVVESISKKSAEMVKGRTDGNKAVLIPRNGTKIGDKVRVKILRANSATLFGEALQ
jgi:tRNA-2-methylthio-N6-dimethylallyladenosine synthase